MPELYQYDICNHSISHNYSLYYKAQRLNSLMKEGRKNLKKLSCDSYFQPISKTNTLT